MSAEDELVGIKDLVAIVLKARGSPEGVEDFRRGLWRAWEALRESPGFLYHDRARGGILRVPGRRRSYERDTPCGILATHSANLEREEAYSRSVFNRRTLEIAGEPGAPSRLLRFIAYEAPLLRLVNERKQGLRKFRVHADLVALCGGALVIVEAKLPGGDPLSSAILQAYAYAFILSCHLARHRGAVLEHARFCLQAYQRMGHEALDEAGPREVQYMIMAPAGYFKENTGGGSAARSVESILAALGGDSVPQPGELQAVENPRFGGFLIVETEHRCLPNLASLTEAIS